MLPPPAMDPSNNTETEDETIALKKKRARRVSFADNEITSVHIFRRDDEDSETPPNSLPSSAADGKPPENDVLGFFRDLGGDSDEEDLKESSPSRNASGDDDDGEAVDVRKSFLRPIGSPSPGSSTAGSVASTDDDDFHGPVSTSFIRPGRLSDSAASDDNNDVTMDSTAFSLHYRSIARSDSGDLRTPTRFGTSFEGNTPSQTSSPAAPGSSMVLTKSCKQSSQPSVPANAVSGGRDSNDMSIVGENPNKYDYDRLSPSLDAILAEEGKDSYAASVLDSTIIDSSKHNQVSAAKQNKNGYLIAKSPETMHYTEKHDMPVQQLLACPSKLGDINRCSMSSPVVQVIDDCLSNKGDITVADAVIDEIQTPDFSTKELKEFVKDANGPIQKQLEFPTANYRIPLKVDAGYHLDVSAQHEPGYQHSSGGELKKINLEGRGHVFDTDDHKIDQVYGNSIKESTPSSLLARNQLFMGSPDLSRHSGVITPTSKQPGFFLHDYVTHGGETLSSIRKSISKLKTSPSKSSLKEGIDRLKHKLSNYSPGSTPSIGKDRGNKHIDTLNGPFEEQSLSATLKNNDQNLIKLDNHGIESVRDIAKVSQNERTVDPEKNEGCFHGISAVISYSDKNPKTVEMVPSSSLMTNLTKVIDLDQADSTVEETKDENAMARHNKCVFSPVKVYDQKLSPSIEFLSNCHDELKELKQHNESVNNGLGHSNAFNSPTVAKQLDLSFSGESERPTSPFEVAVVKQLAQSVSKRKPADSPARRVRAPNTYRKDVIQSPFQDLSTLLPSMQEPTSEPLHQDMQNLSPKGNSDEPVDNNCHQALQVSQSPFAKFKIEFSSGKKRKAIELRDGNHIDKIGSIGRSSEDYKIGNSDQQMLVDWSGDIGSQKENTGDQTWKNWADILIKFSEGTKQLLSPSVDKLNMRVIGVLEDILVHLCKVKKYEILCSEIQSQKMTDPLDALRHKRVVEARILLYNLAYEKAKLQLMHMKRERLLGKVQLLRSRLHESQMLKLDHVPHSSRSRATEGKHEVSCEKVTTMRQELESLKWKSKSLSTYLLTHCKIEGGQSCADTMTVVHDYLRKQMSCKYIFQNLQLWEVDHFEHKQGCYKVLLNYCGYVIQRFTLDACSPSIIISNQLNDQNIAKAFPDMDAFAAFVFVLNPDSTKKCTGSRFLAQETQITSSLLSNLLDVVEEVQLARIEIRNLVQAKFYSQSDGHLDLQLSFIDFYSGRKLKVTLDMTCLKSGVYPVEILPFQVYDPAIGEQKSLPLSLVAEIRSAAESLRVGYSRIMRLCRCISKAVQTRTPSR